MDALVWAVTELVVDPELQEISLMRERDVVPDFANLINPCDGHPFSGY